MTLDWKEFDGPSNLPGPSWTYLFIPRSFLPLLSSCRMPGLEILSTSTLTRLKSQWNQNETLQNLAEPCRTLQNIAELHTRNSEESSHITVGTPFAKRHGRLPGVLPSNLTNRQNNATIQFGQWLVRGQSWQRQHAAHQLRSAKQH